MTRAGRRASRSFDVPCTIEIEQSAESLHAHVALDGDIEIQPGDEVLVRDAPTHIPVDGRMVMRCIATVTRAGRAERFWTRILANLELTGLYEVSFTERRKL